MVDAVKMTCMKSNMVLYEHVAFFVHVECCVDGWSWYAAYIIHVELIILQTFDSASLRGEACYFKNIKEKMSLTLMGGGGMGVVVLEKLLTLTNLNVKFKPFSFIVTLICNCLI